MTKTDEFLQKLKLFVWFVKFIMNEDFKGLQMFFQCMKNKSSSTTGVVHELNPVFHAMAWRYQVEICAAALVELS